MSVLQRPNWYGTPVELGELFVVAKDGRKSVCTIRTHVFGWEVRLFVGQQLEVVQTQVCRTEEEVFSTGEQWKTALVDKGWA